MDNVSKKDINTCGLESFFQSQSTSGTKSIELRDSVTIFGIVFTPDYYEYVSHRYCNCVCINKLRPRCVVRAFIIWCTELWGIPQCVHFVYIFMICWMITILNRRQNILVQKSNLSGKHSTRNPQSVVYIQISCHSDKVTKACNQD